MYIQIKIKAISISDHWIWVQYNVPCNNQKHAFLILFLYVQSNQIVFEFNLPKYMTEKPSLIIMIAK